MPLQDFDASKVTPQYAGMGAHPCGIFDAQISNTYLKPSKDNTYLMFNIEFTTPAGRIEDRFIVDGPSPQAIEIGHKQLSAICHAANIHRVSYPKDSNGSPIFDQAGRELRGGRCKIEVGPQIDKEGKPTNYVEIKKVFDVNGNEPGKQGSPPQQPQMSAPMQQQPNGGWNNNAAVNNAPAPGWGNQPQQQPQNQPQTQGQPAGGWQPGNGGQQAKAPWS